MEQQKRAWPIERGRLVQSATRPASTSHGDDHRAAILLAQAAQL